jgi:hypothetical protein
MPVKLFTALTRFLHRPQPPTPPAPAPFDDGLTDIARLIAADDDPATRPEAADPVDAVRRPDQQGRHLPGRDKH